MEAEKWVNVSRLFFGAHHACLNARRGGAVETNNLTIEETMKNIWRIILAAGLFAGNAWAATPAVAGGSALKQFGNEIADMVERVMPSVVVVRTEAVQYYAARDPFRGRWYKIPERLAGQGSGVIIRKEGYVLTSNHVIEDAQHIQVALPDGTQFSARVVGSDPTTDLAVLRIEKAGSRVFAPIEPGDSDKIRIGEFAIAIGSPFTLNSSVTLGIVSQKGRSVGMLPYEDFIQTDASINPGNSGGPLFDAGGKVIGINTAIIAGGGGGIGFAIPINMARAVVAQLRENGKVTRGYLGIRFQPLTSDLAKSFGLDSEKGALIASVEKDTPAERAGLKAGDIILEFDGKQIVEGTELPRYVAVAPIDKKVKMVIFRDGKKQDVYVAVSKLKDGEQTVADRENSATESNRIGITVQELTNDLAARLGIKESKGLVITEVKAGSPAEDAGVTPGAIIVEINGQHPDSPEKFNAVVAALKKGDIARLLLRRNDGSILYLAVKIE